MIVLLKAYPECVNVKLYKWDPDLPSLPFIEQVHPLIVEDSDIDQQMNFLTQLSQDMEKVATLSKTPFNETNGSTRPNSNNCLFESVADVFCSWANVPSFHRFTSSVTTHSGEHCGCLSTLVYRASASPHYRRIRNRP